MQHKIVPLAALAVALMAAAITPATAAETRSFGGFGGGAGLPYVGQITIFAYDFCPDGWAQTDGRMLSIPEYHTLFALLGTRYGGDGRNSFALPKVAGPATASGALISCISLNGAYPPR